MNSCHAEIEVLVRARFPLIYLFTFEEERASECITYVGNKLSREVHFWTRTSGFGDSSTRDPIVAVDYVLKSGAGLYVMLDPHPYFREPMFVRKLKDAYFALKKSRKNLVLVSSLLQIPQEIEKYIKVVEQGLPGRDELSEVLLSFKEAYSESYILEKGQEERLLSMARGLTLQEFEGVLSRVLVARKKIDPGIFEELLKEKKEIIRKTGVLEYFDPEEGLEDVGGLDLLKEWLVKRNRAFTEEARKFGLPEPKGLLLVGVQGCGKSLVAKAIARYWNLPLLKLDPGRLFAGVVGASEERARRALTLAESLAPAVLWIDEIEKGFSGIESSRYSDAGTASRVYGYIITWMQEKKAPVFIVATANDVNMLPPELVRKGRFDEIFFVDLPSYEERKEIFQIHLKKRHRNPENFDIDYLAEITEGFSGAEIEQVIIDALYEAFFRGRALKTSDIAFAVEETVPISQTMAERISSLRRWAKYRARPASSSYDY